MKRGRKETPEFFKVYVPHVCSQHLKVPRDFVKHLGAVLPQEFKLHNSGQYWYVKPQKIGEDLFLGRGWEAFVKDNSLVYADFLVFKYEGGSNFHVRIYAKNGCLKEPGMTSKEFEKPISSEELESEEESMEESEETYSALEAAERYASGSKYPCFFKAMGRAYLTLRFLAVPLVFTSNYIKERELKVLLQVGNKTWSVNMVTYPDDVGRIYAGWKNFVTANKLQVDDVCVFELIRRIRVPILRVSIFRKH